MASPSLLHNEPTIVGNPSEYRKELIIPRDPPTARKLGGPVRRPTTVRKKSVPTTTSCCDSAPTTSKLASLLSPTVPDDPKRPMKISSRPGVGRPNYRLHPEFVSPGSFTTFVSISKVNVSVIILGIPGPYLRPPLLPSEPNPPMFYIITKGLYVGIFTSW